MRTVYGLIRLWSENRDSEDNRNWNDVHGRGEFSRLFVSSLINSRLRAATLECDGCRRLLKGLLTQEAAVTQRRQAAALQSSEVVTTACH